MSRREKATPAERIKAGQPASENSCPTCGRRPWHNITACPVAFPQKGGRREQ